MSAPPPHDAERWARDQLAAARNRQRHEMRRACKMLRAEGWRFGFRGTTCTAVHPFAALTSTGHTASRLDALAQILQSLILEDKT